MIICDKSVFEKKDIINTINNGFTAIVNVIYSYNNFYLVENKVPTEKVDIEFLQNEFIIVCCYNIEALYRLNPLNNVHCFSYNFNDFTTTNKRYTIAYLNNIPNECYDANNDFVKDLITCSTHDHLLLFTARGRIFWLKAYKVPEVQRYGKGQALVNLLNID